MGSKVPSVSVIAIKNRSGFSKLPDSDLAAAVRKSRAEKNKICLKIAALMVITVSALVACLTAFLVSRGGTGPEFQIKQFSSKMSFSADIKHSKEVATVARAAEKFSKALYGESPQRIQRRHS